MQKVQAGKAHMAVDLQDGSLVIAIDVDGRVHSRRLHAPNQDQSVLCLTGLRSISDIQTCKNLAPNRIRMTTGTHS
jgi:hypothetical protein